MKELIAGEAEEQKDILQLVAIGGIGLFGAPLLLLAILLYVCKDIKGKFITTLRNYVYYKLQIQYFKVVFIALLFDHLMTVAQSSDMEAILTSSAVLTGVAAILLLILVILTLRGELYLEQNRPQIGTLYQNLKTGRPYRFYGYWWFVQRIALVATLVFVRPFFF